MKELRKIIILAMIIFFCLSYEAVNATSEIEKPAVIKLNIPYINESPSGQWSGPWKNACEEASIAMAEQYYTGKKSVTTKDAEKFMLMLFKKETALFGSNTDTNATRTAKVIADYSSYNAKVIDNPTIDEIKNELTEKRPVISLHYGFDLKNKNIPFLRNGSYYHMMVIIGYDDDSREFIVNDTGDIKEGSSHRYDYNLFINSLHDFDHAQKKANGTPRVLFTYPKLVKAEGKNAIYYLNGNEKQYVSHPKIFKTRGWGWGAVNAVDEAWLDGFEDGEVIR